MDTAHDLALAPSLLDAHVANDVWHLPAAVGAGTRCRTTCVCETTGSDVARGGSRTTEGSGACVDDFRHTTGFSRDRGRETVAELCSVGHHVLTAVAGVGLREEPEVRVEGTGVEVIERRRAAEGEPSELDKGLVGVELVGRVVEAFRVGAQTNRDVAANRAVFGLVASISRDVTAFTPPQVVGVAVVAVRVKGRNGRTVHAPGSFGANPAADLQAHVSARDVIEPRTVQATDLHVLDRLGLDGKIGSLRPSHRNETRCAAQEKAFHHLHLDPPKHCFFESVPHPLGANGTDPTLCWRYR